MRCFDVCQSSVQFQVAIAPVIGKNENDIGLPGLLEEEISASKSNNKCECGKK